MEAIGDKTLAAPEHKEALEVGSQMKLDPHGFPLRPQPSDDPRGKYQYSNAVEDAKLTAKYTHSTGHTGSNWSS